MPYNGDAECERHARVLFYTIGFWCLFFMRLIFLCSGFDTWNSVSDSRLLYKVSNDRANGTLYKFNFHLLTLNNFPFELNDNKVWDLALSAWYNFPHILVQSQLVKLMKDINEYEAAHDEWALRYIKHIKREFRFIRLFANSQPSSIVVRWGEKWSIVILLQVS